MLAPTPIEPCAEQRAIGVESSADEKSCQMHLMLKKINVQQLRKGMFIHELCSPWLNTPFWKTSFMLDDQATLAKIRQAHINEAWIDIARGLDVGALLA